MLKQFQRPFKDSDFFNTKDPKTTFSAHYIPKNSYVSEGLFEIFTNINIRNIKGHSNNDQENSRILLRDLIFLKLQIPKLQILQTIFLKIPRSQENPLKIFLNMSVVLKQSCNFQEPSKILLTFYNTPRVLPYSI